VDQQGELLVGDLGEAAAAGQGDLVLVRLFPWAPPDEDSWEALRWAKRRGPIGERPRLAPDWVAHPAPSTSGTAKTRISGRSGVQRGGAEPV